MYVVGPPFFRSALKGGRFRFRFGEEKKALVEVRVAKQNWFEID
jgi:hypothetical protein